MNRKIYKENYFQFNFELIKDLNLNNLNAGELRCVVLNNNNEISFDFLSIQYNDLTNIKLEPKYDLS